MKILSNDYSSIKKDLLEAINIIKKSDDIDQIVSAYIGVSNFYEDIQLKKELAEVNQKFKQLIKSYKWNLAKCKTDDYLQTFDEKISINGDLYFEIYKNELDIINKTATDITNINCDYIELDDHSIYDILIDYFRQYDNQMIEFFENMVTKKVIYESILPFQLGVTTGPKVFDNTYVRIKRQSNFEEMLVILHEISHARFIENIVRTKSDKEFNIFVCTNLYSEVYPRLQERSFLQYLLNNNLLVEDVKKYFVKWYMFLYRILNKNIESYKNNKSFNYCDIKDINSFLYRDLLFLNNYTIDSDEKLKNTAIEEYYTSNYSISDISDAVAISSDKIKRLVK